MMMKFATLLATTALLSLVSNRYAKLASSLLTESLAQSNQVLPSRFEFDHLP